MKLIILMSLMLLHSCQEKTDGDNATATAPVVRPARATWATGHFQEAVVRKGLEQLGYQVDKARDLQNPIFYQAVTMGDVDYWCNSWMPDHLAQTPKGFTEKARAVGAIVKNGGLNGYLVSKFAVEKYGIKSIEDFKRPEVRKAFDVNGDGLADLVGCPPGWGCEKTLSHHKKVYGFDEFINIITASYDASFAAALARHLNGQPILYYTWAPNWTVNVLKPGKDVMWINVPKIIPMEQQKGMEDRLQLDQLEGAVTSPIKLGMMVADIQIVANNRFLERHPRARKFFEIFSLSVDAISEQNKKMRDGEKSPQDISRHAREWIAANQQKWDKWIKVSMMESLIKKK